MHARLPLFVGLAGLLLSSAAAAGQQTQVPALAALFDPPRAVELQAVRDDWAARDPAPREWRLEASGLVAGHETRVVSHVVDGNRHYGLIRLPRNFAAGGSFPVLVYLHGGAAGLKLPTVQAFDNHIPGERFPDEFVYVAPSFRSEPLDAGPLGTFLSEGEPSTLDRDVDDAMALLGVCFATVPEADRLRVAVFGSSRGGGVALLLGARDPRVKLLAEVSGLADLLLPRIEADVMDILTSRRTADSPALRRVMQVAVEPYVAGTITLTEARLRLIRSSPAWFASDLPGLQFHHGAQDDVVLMDHSGQLATQLATHGSVPWNYQVHPTGKHGLGGMPSSGRWIEGFLGELLEAPASYCGAAARDGARMDYIGQPSVAGEEFILSVTGAAPAAAGMFLFSPTQGQTQLGQGLLCLGAPLARVASKITGPNGEARARLRMGVGPFQPGTTFHFQFAYQVGSTQYTSDALLVEFGP